MLSKRFMYSKDMWKIVFELPVSHLPPDIEVHSVAVAGEFNAWQAAAAPMELGQDGVYRAAIQLPPRGEFQFRYVANGGYYFNDWQADGYVTNDFGGENCLIVTGDSKSFDEEE